ncbi:MAG: hypothetical protein R2827_04870 [Bdellovibrionales bacterium]
MLSNARVTFIYSIILFLSFLGFEAYACTKDKVKAAHSTSSSKLRNNQSVNRIINESLLTGAQLCLMESLFNRSSIPNNDINELRVFNAIAFRGNITPDQQSAADYMIQNSNPSNDIDETSMIRSFLGLRIQSDYQGEQVLEVNPTNQKLNAGKVELIKLAIDRASSENGYPDQSLIYAISSGDFKTADDFRNAKIMLLTAGDGQYSREKLLDFLSRAKTTRAKDLLTSVAAFEHPNNRVEESWLIRAISERESDYSDSEYECINKALQAYLAPGVEGKSYKIVQNLGAMIRDRTCESSPYFNNHSGDPIDVALNSALIKLEAGEKVTLRHQPVGNVSSSSASR